MPDAAKRSTDLIIGRGLITAEAIAQKLRIRLAHRLARNFSRMSFHQLLGMARQVLGEFEPLLATAMADTEIAAWVRGLGVITNRTPQRILALFTSGFPPLVPPGLVLPPDLTIGDAGPIVVFPRLQEATQALVDRNIVTRPQFDSMTREAQGRAFTVAGQTNAEVIGRIRDVLAEEITEGTSFGKFKKRMREELDVSWVGPGHLSNVYRTNTQAAFADGQEVLFNNPIIREAFPYARYTAIDDGRVRDNHLALETLGLSGTNIYRMDDPVWDIFTPPWDYMCRCSKTAMTILQAAKAGVREAKRWNRTGQPPDDPEFRIDDIPFRPTNNFVGPRRRVA